MISRNVIALRPAEEVGIDPFAVAAGQAAFPAAPFADDYGEHGYFETTAQRELLDRLFHELPHDEAALLIHGPAGSGKTSFLQHFLRQAPSDWEIIPLHARIALGEAHLVRHLNGVLFPDQSLNSATLTRLLLTRARGDTFLVLVVDDAHRLSPFALRLLLMIKRAVVDRGGHMGLVLFASGAIDQVLATPSIAEMGAEIIRRFDLPAFSVAETGDYIRQRLAGAGISPPPALDDKRLRILHRQARGRPQAINRLAARLLPGDRKKLTRLQWVDGFLVRYKTFLLSLVAFAALFLAGLLIYDGLSNPRQPRSAMDEVAIAEHFPPPLPAPLPVEKVPTPPAAATTVSPAPAAAPPPAAADGKKAVSPVQAKPKPTPKATAKPQPKPKPKAAAAPQPAAGVVHDSSWVMEQDAAAFTIQLTSWADQGRAIKYIENNQLHDDAAYVHTRTRGKDWYLVVYHTYPSLGQARQAIQTLPPSLKKYGPWVRNISSLQSLAVLE